MYCCLFWLSEQARWSYLASFVSIRKNSCGKEIRRLTSDSIIFFAVDERCGPHHLSITQTKPRLSYFTWHFSHRISSQWRYFGIAPPRAGQNHWRSKHQIVERHTYHPKQKRQAENRHQSWRIRLVSDPKHFFTEISRQSRLMVRRFFLTLQVFGVLWICFLS